MGQLLAEAAERYTFDQIAVVFEHSQRTEPLIRDTFSSEKTYSEAARRWQVPTRFYFANKGMAEPLVEVADFVMHAAGTSVRSFVETGKPPLRRKDFAAVSTWLRKAEARAELPKFNGGLWHPYRRLWATERQHLPDVAVAEAGGWRDLRSLKNSYQKARAEDVAAVVNHALGRQKKNA